MNSVTVTNGTTKTNFDQVSEDTWEIWQCVDEASGEWLHIGSVTGVMHVLPHLPRERVTGVTTVEYD